MVGKTSKLQNQLDQFYIQSLKLASNPYNPKVIRKDVKRTHTNFIYLSIAGINETKFNLLKLPYSFSKQLTFLIYFRLQTKDEPNRP